jgi:hypothetical protein
MIEVPSRLHMHVPGPTTALCSWPFTIVWHARMNALCEQGGEAGSRGSGAWREEQSYERSRERDRGGADEEPSRDRRRLQVDDRSDRRGYHEDFERERVRGRERERDTRGADARLDRRWPPGQAVPLAASVPRFTRHHGLACPCADYQCPWTQCMHFTWSVAALSQRQLGAGKKAQGGGERSTCNGRRVPMFPPPQPQTSRARHRFVAFRFVAFPLLLLVTWIVC